MAFITRTGRQCLVAARTCFATLALKEADKNLKAMNIVITYLNTQVKDARSTEGTSLKGRVQSEVDDFNFVSQSLEKIEWSLVRKHSGLKEVECGKSKLDSLPYSDAGKLNEILWAFNTVIACLNKQATDVRLTEGSSLKGRARCSEEEDLRSLAHHVEKLALSFKGQHSELKESEEDLRFVDHLRGKLDNAFQREYAAYKAGSRDEKDGV